LKSFGVETLGPSDISRGQCDYFNWLESKGGTAHLRF